MTGFRTVGAAEEKSFAAQENFLLFGKRRIERQSGRLLNNQREIRPFQRIERRRCVDWREIDRVNGVIGREVTRIVRHEPLRDAVVVEGGIDQRRSKVRLMITESNDKKSIVREVSFQPRPE